MPTYRIRNGRHQVQVRIKSGGQVIYQESATFDTRAQAEHWGTALERKLEREGFAQHQASKTTLADLMDTHVRSLADAGRETYAIENRFKQIKAYPFTKKPVDAITSADFVDWAVTHSEGRSPATILNHLMSVRAAFRAAPVAYGVPVDVKVVADAIDHLRRVRVVANSRQRDRRVTDEEIDRIEKQWNRMHGTTIPLPTIMRLLIVLPRRREELMTAKWEDYDEVNHTLLLRDTKHPTNERDELIPVPEAAQKILALLPRTTGNIFPHLGKSVSSAFHRVTKLLGMEDIHLHDLRHEGISRLFEAGLNIPEVALISGHTSWATLRRYTHIQPRHVLEKLNAGRQGAT